MLIQHEYKVNQEVWYYKADLLVVKRGIISDLEWDDEEECYMYTIAPEQMPGVVHIVPEHQIRDNEYEAHDLLKEYIEISYEAEQRWLEEHKDENPDA